MVVSKKSILTCNTRLSAVKPISLTRYGPHGEALSPLLQTYFPKDAIVNFQFALWSGYHPIVDFLWESHRLLLDLWLKSESVNCGTELNRKDQVISPTELVNSFRAALNLRIGIAEFIVNNNEPLKDIISSFSPAEKLAFLKAVVKSYRLHKALVRSFMKWFSDANVIESVLQETQNQSNGPIVLLLRNRLNHLTQKSRPSYSITRFFCIGFS